MGKGQALLTEAAASGISVALRGDRLHLEGTGTYPASLIMGIRKHKTEVLTHLRHGEVLDRIEQWAKHDPKRWGKVLRSLRQDWLPQKPGPRASFLVWAAAHCQLATATRKLNQMSRFRRAMNQREQTTYLVSKEDISFYKGMIPIARTKALASIRRDLDVRRCLERLMNPKQKLIGDD